LTDRRPATNRHLAVDDDRLRGSHPLGVPIRLAAQTAKSNPRYANGGYEAWPGPNSNTFVRELTQEIPELAFAFDHNAVGKDYTWFDAGLAPSRTGVHLDTWPLGATLAAKEGIELHLLQLTFGLRFWPPRLELPFLPAIPWERAPDEPAAPHLAPKEGEMLTIYPLEEPDAAGSGRFEITSQFPALKLGQTVVVMASTGESWLRLKLLDTPPLAGEPSTTYRVSAVVSWKGETELTFVCRGEPSSRDEVGPFALEGATVSCWIVRDASGGFDGQLTVRGGR
jgi:hypothetical protein